MRAEDASQLNSTAKSEGPGAPDRLLKALLVLTIVLGVCFRLYGLGIRPLWDDEAFAYFVGAGSYSHLWHSLTLERHPPLFYSLEWVAIHLFGPSETSLRVFPALFGTALIYVVFVIGKRLADLRGGLVAAALVAMSPILLYHAQEARSSSLLTLGLVVSSWLLWDYCERPRWSTGIGAVLAGWVAMTAHYLGLSIIPLAILIYLIRTSRQRLTGLPPVIGVLAGFAALLPLIMQQRQGVYGGAISFATDQDLPLPAAVVRSVLLLGNGGYPEGLVRNAGYGLFGLALLATLAVGLSSRDTRWRMTYPALVAGFVLTFLRLGGVVLHWPVRDNYMPPVAPGVYLLVSVLAVNGMWRRFGRWMAAAVFLAMLPGSVLLVLGTGHPNPDFRSAVQRVEALAPDGVLLARTWGDLACYRYYDRQPRHLGVFGLEPGTSPTIESEVVATHLESTDEVIRQSRKICILGKDSGQSGFDALSGALTEAGFRQVDEYRPYGVRVLLWERNAVDKAAGN